MSGDQEEIVSVFELTHRLKRTLEQLTSGCWVAGEVQSLSTPASGHIYLCLKDEERDAAVDCVMYRREAMRHGKHLRVGAKVQLRGRASIYAPRGRLQWICDAARPAGKGALLEALARLRQKLIDEGLTDPSRKRPLPPDPRVVGVVTSSSGAAFHDIKTVALRRNGVRLILSPALVQGDQAPQSLIAAIDLIERVAEVEVLIVGRGGGSQEDLMAFNDERVVRRIAACRVPVVSAVGHEIDISLSDLVADARAATPSEAAELVVPDASERSSRLLRTVRQLAGAMRVRLAERQYELDRARRLLSDPRFVLAEHEQQLDELSLRMERAMVKRLGQERTRAAELRRRLEARHPRLVVERARGRLGPLRLRLEAAMRRGQETRGFRLGEAGRALGALSPLSILGRGYALAREASGRAIRDASELSIGQDVSVRVGRGTFSASVTAISSAVYTRLGLPHESDQPGDDGGSEEGKDS